MRTRRVRIDPHGYTGGKACWQRGSTTPTFADAAQVWRAYLANQAAVAR